MPVSTTYFQGITGDHHVILLPPSGEVVVRFLAELRPSTGFPGSEFVGAEEREPLELAIAFFDKQKRRFKILTDPRSRSRRCRIA